MPFSDPAGGFFSPSNANTGPVDIPTARLQPLPGLDNINSPRSQPFEMIRPVNYEPDKTAGVAFNAIGEGLKTAVEAVDSAYKIQVGQEVRSGIEGVLNQQIQAGLDRKQEILETQATAKQYLADAPSGLSQGINRLETIQKAARSGSMSDSNYQVQSQEVLSGLRARYPGYSALINDTAERLYGVSPERQRAALQRDLDAIQKAQVDKLDYWQKQFWENRGVLGEDYMNRPFQENVQKLIRHETVKTKNATDAAAVMAQEKAGVAPWQEAANHLSWQTTGTASQMMDEFVKGLERSSGFKVSDLMSGKLPPEQVTAAIGALRAMNDQLTRTMQTHAATHEFNPANPGLTPGNILRNAGKGDEAQKIIETNNPFPGMIAALTNGQSGVIVAETQRLTMMKDATDYNIAANNPQAYKWGRILQSMGPAGANLLSKDENVTRSFGGIMGDVIRRENLTSQKPFSETITTGNSRYKSAYNLDPPAALNKRLIDDKLTAISADGVDKQTQNDNWKQLYGDPNNTFLIEGVRKSGGGASAAVDVFNRFIDPKITQKALREMPEDRKREYLAWGQTNFANLSVPLAEDVAANVKRNPYFDIKYDPASGKYAAEPTALGKARPTDFQQAINNPYLKLNKLNTTLEAMKPIVEANGQKFNDWVEQSDFSKKLSGDAIKKDASLTDGSLQRGGSAKSAPFSSTPRPTETTTGSTPLKDLLRRGEASGSYDLMFGDKNFKATSMTVGEVLEEQKRRINSGAKSVAVGGYQFINSTLDNLVKKLGIDKNEKFTPELQERLADKLLDDAGYQDYKAGKLPKSTMIDRISGIWAAAPNSKGKGTYDGDGLNAANIKLSELESVL